MCFHVFQENPHVGKLVVLFGIIVISLVDAQDKANHLLNEVWQVEWSAFGQKLKHLHGNHIARHAELDCQLGRIFQRNIVFPGNP